MENEGGGFWAIVTHVTKACEVGHGGTFTDPA
jgi:hypothetical protein